MLSQVIQNLFKQRNCYFFFISLLIFLRKKFEKLVGFFSEDISMQGGLTFSNHISILSLVCYCAVSLQDFAFSYIYLAVYVNSNTLVLLMEYNNIALS